MKKLLAIVLALMVFSTSLSFANAPKETNISDSDTNVAVELLKILNIFSEADIRDNSSFVTKENFAKCLGKLLKLDGTGANQTKHYNDVPEQSIINVLTDLKIFDIPADKAFNPHHEITAGEVLRSLVNALVGYLSYENDVKIEDYKYPQIAKQLGIVKNYNTASKVTFNEMAGMMYNTLLTTAFQVQNLVNFSDKKYNFDKHDTLLSILYDVYLIKGLVTANTYVSIYENVRPTADNQIMIDAKLYNCKDINSSGYIGQYVLAFYKQTDFSDIKDIIYIELDSAKNDYIEITSDDVVSLNKMVLKYMENNNYSSIMLEKPLLIYNGEALFDLGVTDIIDILKIERTRIRFCKSSNDDKYSLIFAEHYENGNVAYIDLANESIYVRLGGVLKEIPIKRDDSEVYAAAFKDDGAKISLKDIKVGDLVSCAISYNEQVYKTYVCTKTVTGQITNIDYGNDKTYVTINDVIYAVEASFAEKKLLSLDNINTYRLDYLGYIADVFSYGTEGYVLGYIYAREKPKGLTEKYKYKIYTQNDQHLTVTSYKKVEINGEVRSADEIDAILAPNGILNKQIIRIKINEDNSLRSIDTAEQTPQESGISLTMIADTGDYISEAQPTTAQYMFWSDISGSDGVAFPCKPNTIVFGVPPTDSTDIQEKDFSISNCKDWMKHQITYRVAFYKISDEESSFVDVVLHERESSWSWRNEDMVYMVNDISKVLLDGENYISINALSSAVSGSVKLLCNMSVKFTRFENEYSVTGDVLMNMIGSGDLIQVGDSADGSISHIRLLYDYSEDKTFWTKDNYSYEVSTTDNDSTYGVRYRTLKCVYGYISDIKRTKDKERTYIYIADFNTGEVKYSYSIGSNAGINIFDDDRNYVKAYKSYSRDLFSYASVGDISKATKCFVAINGDNVIRMYFYN